MGCNRRSRQGLAAFFLLIMIAVGCSDGDPEMTIEERLEEIEGHSLTQVEVDELLSLASSICQLNDPVLESLWTKLTVEQFDFQDFVFNSECPERATFYALSTGRVVTDEAKEATTGVILPTTRLTTVPPSTTPTTVRPATTTSPSSDGASTSPTLETSGTTTSTAPTASGSETTDVGTGG